MRPTRPIPLLLRTACALFWAACAPWPGAASPAGASETASTEAPLADGTEIVLRPMLGDLDAMAERGHLIVLTTASRTHYFLDGPRPRGLTYEGMERFREFLNERLGRKSRPIAFVYLTVPRDALIPRLLEGRGDLIAANLTITDERARQVAFSKPVITGVRELLVTGPDLPDVRTLEDMAGHSVAVRASSSYRSRLDAINADFAERGLAPIGIEEVDERLEDDDVLELVAAGLLPATIVDDHTVGLWGDVIEGLVVHDDIAFHEGGEIASAVRQDSPKLREMLDAFAQENKKGTLFGNILFKRYLQQNRWVRSPVAEAHRKRFLQLCDVFRRYGNRYDFEWLLLAAQGYQESGLDQAKRSPAGAVGIMQLLPSTARSPEVGIPDIDDLESNVHAGTKYMRFLADNYFSDPDISPRDRMLLSFAAYNAGPNRIQRLRQEAADAGLDPNRWFGNVELVVAQRVGREPVQYVGNIAKYYAAYKLVLREEEERERLRSEAQAHR